MATPYRDNAKGCLDADVVKKHQYHDLLELLKSDYEAAKYLVEAIDLLDKDRTDSMKVVLVLALVSSVETRSSGRWGRPP